MYRTQTVCPVLYLVSEFHFSAETLGDVTTAKSRTEPNKWGLGSSLVKLIDGGVRLMAPVLFLSKSKVVNSLSVSRSLMDLFDSRFPS